MQDLADWLSLAALVAAVLALALALVALRRSVSAARYQRWRSRRRRISESRLPTDVRGLRAEVEALRQENSEALRHLSVVRYDAFGDMGGRLSFTAALSPISCVVSSTTYSTPNHGDKHEPVTTEYPCVP